jgi:hypothetical protein
VLLANPSHGDVALASVDARYQLTGVIHSRVGGYRYASDELESYLVPKKPVEDVAALVERTGCGIAYTRSAYAYLFRRALTRATPVDLDPDRAGRSPHRYRFDPGPLPPTGSPDAVPSAGVTGRYAPECENEAIDGARNP